MRRDERVTDAMFEAGLAEYSEGGCMGLDDRERREVVTAIIEAAVAALSSAEEKVVDLAPCAHVTGFEPVAWQPKYTQEVIAHHRRIRSDLPEYATTVYPTKGEAENFGHGGHDVRPLYDRPVAVSSDIHPDDLAVDHFAAAIKAKLAKKRAEGLGGWDNPDECSIAFLSDLLRSHIAKGDPVDVGNLAMMIHQRGGAVE